MHEVKGADTKSPTQEKRGVCPGCKQERYVWHEHHWPQELALAEARKQGKSIKVCVSCNQKLRSIFPYIPDIPWDLQQKCLQTLLNLTQDQSEEREARTALLTFAAATSKAGGILAMLHSNELLKWFEQNPGTTTALDKYLVRVQNVAAVRNVRDEYYEPPQDELVVDFAYLSHLLEDLERIHPETFWVGKVPDTYLPYIGVLEYHIVADRRTDFLPPGTERIPDKFDDTADGVLKALDSLERAKSRAAQMFLGQQDVNPNTRRVLERYQTILTWILTSAPTTPYKLLTRHRETFGLTTTGHKDLRALVNLDYLTLTETPTQFEPDKALKRYRVALQGIVERLYHLHLALSEHNAGRSPSAADVIEARGEANESLSGLLSDARNAYTPTEKLQKGVPTVETLNTEILMRKAWWMWPNQFSITWQDLREALLEPRLVTRAEYLNRLRDGREPLDNDDEV